MKLWDVDFKPIFPSIVEVSSVFQIVAIYLPMKVIFFFFIRVYIQITYVTQLVVVLRLLLVLTKRLLQRRKLTLRCS